MHCFFKSIFCFESVISVAPLLHYLFRLWIMQPQEKKPQSYTLQLQNSWAITTPWINPLPITTSVYKNDTVKKSDITKSLCYAKHTTECPDHMGSDHMLLEVKKKTKTCIHQDILLILSSTLITSEFDWNVNLHTHSTCLEDNQLKFTRVHCLWGLHGDLWSCVLWLQTEKKSGVKTTMQKYACVSE